MTQVSSEGSTVSTDDLGVPPTPPRSPPASTDSNGVPVPPPSWNDPSSPSQNKSPNNNKNKSKIPFFDSINSRFMGQKKTKKSHNMSEDRPKWNSGPGLRKNEDFGSLRRKSITDLSSSGGRTISRSRSATSEGGFQTLGRDTPLRQSNRSPSCRPHQSSGYGKLTWSGSRAARDRAPLTADTYKPPPGNRSIRSASASPASVRRHFGTSAPTTPVNRSPKRSAPTSSIGSPTKPLPNHLLKDIPTLAAAEPNIEILAHLEDLVNSYRARVLQTYTAEGKSLPPELADDITWDKGEGKSPCSLPNIPKVTPRKASAGSRIPAPTFFTPE